MAKPPVPPPLSASLGGQARPKPGVLASILFTLAFFGMTAFAAPTCVLLLVGLVPTVVAYVVDRDSRRMLTFTVGPLNLAGLTPFLLQLWTGQDSMAAVVRLLSNLYVWLVVYLAAGAGWLLFMGTPAVVSAVLDHSLDRRKAKLLASQKALRDEWGEEVER